MKYTEEIVINRSKEEVGDLIGNPDNAVKWMKGLVSMSALEGRPGERGSTSQLVFDMGKRQMAMKETIIENELPNAFSAIYEADGVWSRQDNVFQEVDPGTTRWISTNHFRFTNVMMKIMGLFMGGAFRKQSCRYMQDFKAFVEEGKRVNEPDTPVI